MAVEVVSFSYKLLYNKNKDNDMADMKERIEKALNYVQLENLILCIDLIKDLAAENQLLEIIIDQNEVAVEEGRLKMMIDTAKENKALKAENQRYKDALEFYAEFLNWKSFGHIKALVFQDEGTIAKQALAKEV